MTRQLQGTGKNRTRLACLFWGAILLCTDSEAQLANRTPAGTLQRLTQTLKRIPASREPTSPPSLSGSVSKGPGAPTNIRAQITQFRFMGNTQVSSQALSAELSDLTGRALTLAEIDQAAERITALYVSKGYNVARAVIPPQDIVDQSVTLVILEGMLQEDGLELVDFSEGQIDLDRISGILEAQIDLNTPIRRKAYERALRLVENLPGVTLKSWLYPGQAIGTARLRTELYATPRHQNVVAVDNHGYRPTGAWRTSIDSVHENTWGHHEQIRLDASVSDARNVYLGASAQLPLGTDGWALVGQLDHIQYDVRREFSVNNEHGSAQHLGLGFSYPLQLLSDVSWVTQQTLNLVRQRDAMRGFDTEQRDVHFLESTLRGDITWNASGSANTTLRMSMSFGSAQAPANELRSTQGDFAVLVGEVSHMQALGDGLVWWVQGKAQTASRHLNGYFACTLGGPYANRAYPTGQVAADRCLQLNNELFLQTNATWRYSIFLDWARARQTAPGLNGTGMATDKLASAGLSLTAFLRQNDSISLTVARQLTRSVERQAFDRDVDRLNARYRAWLQAQMAF
jgi:hemolysin activation/secretion protein